MSIILGPEVESTLGMTSSTVVGLKVKLVRPPGISTVSVLNTVSVSSAGPAAVEGRSSLEIGSGLAMVGEAVCAGIASASSLDISEVLGRGIDSSPDDDGLAFTVVSMNGKPSMEVMEAAEVSDSAGDSSTAVVATWGSSPATRVDSISGIVLDSNSLGLDSETVTPVEDSSSLVAD